MTFQLAIKTKQLIDQMLEADQGAAYRVKLGEVLPHIGDAYRGADEGFRTHLGASMIGRKCAREIWYGYRWFLKSWFPAKIIRLFNRGHLEEGRFIALLLAAGIQVWQQDANGKQFRISDLGGHLGGSGDGVCLGIPDIPVGAYCLLEFKTHNTKNFAKVVKSGVRIAKPEHFSQMQMYMRKMGLSYALYGAVNKDTDEIHWEIVQLETLHADLQLERGRTIIMMRSPPERLHNSSAWYECTYCNFKSVCHEGASFEKNCRTCSRSEPLEDGTWRCNFTSEIISKETQLTGCDDYISLEQ